MGEIEWSWGEYTGFGAAVARVVFECATIMGNQEIRFLEIGVYKGGASKFIFDSGLNFTEYVGVDPYGACPDDPYFDSYWRYENPDEIYIRARSLYQRYSFARLIRASSEEFFSTNNSTYDLIYIDGDHREQPAYRDMQSSLGCIRQGGFILVDDYGNSDTPQVTRAVNRFISANRKRIGEIGRRVIQFQNAGKHVPISKTLVVLHIV